MVTYASNELISSSEFAKKFGSYLSQIKESTIDKIAVLKNNKVEAVLVSKDDYERMSAALEIMEHREIYDIVQQRPYEEGQSISFEEMAKRHNINIDELN
jgi:PHD/YefM family antitoxin component YafN of YafNO toxin-antitoxin module